MFKKSWVPGLVLGITQGVMAQTMPSAGSQMQQIPVAPMAPPAPPAMEVPAPPVSSAAEPLGQEALFVAQRLSIVGGTVYPESALLAMTGFEAGRSISLQTLHQMAQNITQHYRQAGYWVARAYVPAQEIRGGVVTIAVLEGRYGQVALNNDSTLDSQVASRLMSGLAPGDIVQRQPLEDRLLRLSDLPGVQVRSTLMPGAMLGQSDLIVEVKPGDQVSGSVDADNAGSRYTGENRVGMTLNLNNPTGQGDQITLRALTSGSGMLYGRAAYQTPWGLGRVGAAYSDLRYELGREFTALDANGHARIATLFGHYPVVRSRAQNFNVGLTLDAKAFEDRLDAISLVTKKEVRMATFTLSGDQRDLWGGGGLNSYVLAWSTGQLKILSAATLSLDAASAQTQGHFDKLTVGLSRVQHIAPTLTWLASVKGQAASKNLDVSEKMALGGMHGVRAYPEGEAYADEGVLLTLEVRKQLSLPDPVVGQIHIAAFVDAGAVKLNHSPWAAGDNIRHLSGAGLGLYWTRVRDFSIKAFYARKLGSEAALSAPDKSGRFWIQAVKYF